MSVCIHVGGGRLSGLFKTKEELGAGEEWRGVNVFKRHCTKSLKS